MIDTQEFDQTISALRDDLARLRAGMASPAIVDDVRVMAYETQMGLRELASLSTPDSHTIVIEPWDKTLLKAIEKGLQEAELGMQPVVDSDKIRLNLPALTEEKRLALVKQVHEKAEAARIRLRKHREEVLKQAKQDQKAGTLSEDDYFAFEKEMQKLIDEYNGRVKEAVDLKEKELMTV